MATFLRFYTPDIIGSSLGNHITEVELTLLLLDPHLCLQMCYGLLCPPFQYEPKKDVFNAAQSGAMVTDLVKHELSYLIKQVREVGCVCMCVRGEG